MTTQYPQLMDAIPVTAALQRLFKANVMNDDQLYDYSLAQALRSVFWAVKKGNSANGQYNGTFNSDINGIVQSQGPSELCNAEDCNNTFYVIKELCRSATVSLPHVHTCVYLSLRLLCDEASAYGQGNERPCVTEEWIDTLTSFVHSTSSAWHVDRRANLGFLIVTSAMLHGVVWCGAYNGSNIINKMNDISNSNNDNNSQVQLETLTMMHNYNENSNTTITASVKHKALFVHFTKLVHDWIHVVLPALSILASNAAALSGEFVDNVKEENNNKNSNHNNTNENQYPNNTIAATTTTTTTTRTTGRRNDDKRSIMFTEIEHTFRPPSRLVVEANNCIIHCFHALCTDVLHVHASETNTNTSHSAQNVCKVLDRELPLELWSSLTHVRNALRRGLEWMVEEIKHHCLEYYKNYHDDESQCSLLSETEVEQHVEYPKLKVEEEEERFQENSESSHKETSDRVLRMVNQISAPFMEISTIVEHVVSSMLHEQERFSAMRTEVRRKYGDGAKDYHALTDIMFAHTLHMCVCMREIAWSWMRVSGSLFLQNMTYFTKFFTLPRVGAGGQYHANKDESVLMNLAQCLMQLPEAGCYSSFSSSSSSPPNDKEEANVSIATTILLSACLTFFITAPLRSTQARIWQSNVDVTREIHGLLVQRGLRYRNNHVLELTSLLSDSIMSSSLSSLDELCESAHDEPECYEHASSVFASQLISTSSEQLLDMIATDRDGASETAKKLLCHAILGQPHVIIPSLFRLLSHGSTTARLNVLDILHTLPQLTTNAPFTLTTNEHNNIKSNMVACDNNTINQLTVSQSANKCSAKEKRSREMLRLLAQHLLLHIHDEELCVRMQTSELFSRVAIEDVLEPLLRLYMQTDSTGRKQSVSLASLRSVMAAHSTSAQIIFLLLETTYELAEPANLTNIEESKHVHESKKEETRHDDHGSEGVIIQASSNELTTKRNNIPHTPGDVLPLSLLYAHEENVDHNDITYSEHLEQIKDGNNKEIRKDNNANSNTDTSSHSAKARHDKFNHLINTLLEHWVENVKQITPSVFITSLLRFLQEKGKSINEREVQWHVKYITHLLSIISLYATKGKGQWNQEEACGAIMSDTYHVFFEADESEHNAASFSSKTPATENRNNVEINILSLNETIDNAWCNTLVELCSPCNNNNSNILVYKLLLPLLCLRAYHRELYKVLWSQTTRKSNLPIQCICTALWTGVAISCSCAFSTKYTEIQRVLLEVLTRFPSCVFFDQLAQIENKEKLNSPSVFWERVFTFGLCAYLNLIITQAASKTSFSCCSSADKVSKANTAPGQQQQEQEKCKDDYTAVMQQLPMLLELTNKRILPWLASDETTVTATTKQATQVTTHIDANYKQGNSRINDTANKEESNVGTVEMQKLSCACIDAFALIVYVNLLHTALPNTLFFSNNKDEYNTTKLYDIDAFSVRPFTTLANTFRTNTVQKDINTTSLSLFQFCVHVQKRLLAILRTQLMSSDAVLLKWWQVYLPLFTELANAACSWLSKRKIDKMEQTSQENCKHAEEFAVVNASTLHIAKSCCEILFYAVMASAHRQASTTISHPSSSQVAIQPSTNYNAKDVNLETADNQQSIFAKMACDDQQALMHFALGTAKYYKLPSVQSIGVKLLSALLAAAPELFINLSTSKSKKDEEKLNAGNALDQFKLWHDALSALASVAHIHPDSATRVLAERVLSAFATEQ